MYQQQTIGRSLPIIAKVVAGQMGIDVRFDDKMGAHVNHTTRVIHLPSLKAIGSEEDATVIEGLLDHEAAHLRFSDPEYTLLGHQMGVVFNGFRNLIEDIRIERAIGQVFPGSKKNLNRTAGLMRKLGFFTEPEADAHPANKLMALLLYALRYEELGHSFCQDWVDPAKDYARQDFGDVADQVLECARAATKLGQTAADVHRAVETIMAVLKASSQEQPQPRQGSQQQGEQGEQDDSQKADGQSGSGKGESGENQDESDQEQDVQDQAAKGEETDGDSQGQAGKGEETDGNGNDSDAAASGSKGDDADNSEDGSVGGKSEAQEGPQGSDSASGSSESGESKSQTQSQANAREGAGGSGAGQCDPSTAQAVLDAEDSDLGSLAKGLEELIRESGLLEGDHREATEVEQVSGFPLNPNDAVYRKRITDARKATTRIALKLDQLLQARKDVDRHLAYSGRIDTSRLARTRIGDVRIFQKSDENEAINTAVYMVLDRSGSMSGTIDTVYLAAASMGEVMSRFDVKVAAALFDDVIDPLGTFDEPWRKFVARMSLQARGGTQMGAATTFAVGQLAKRTEERKILMYVTDGAPNSFEALEAAVSESRRYGIEATAVLIGVADCHLRQFEKIMPTGVAANDAEIPAAVFRALRNLL